MRLGIVADVHGNIEALDLALEMMGPVDEVLCAGDFSDQGRFSNEVTARLREIGARCVQGNHDDALLSPNRPPLAGARQDLLEWTAAQPLVVRTTIAGKRLLMYHASVWSPLSEYVYPHSPKLKLLGDQDADIIVYGHTHTQYVGRVGSTLVINPGSVGQPRDHRNGRRDSFVVLDLPSEEAVIHDFDDPVLTRGELLR